LSFPESSECQTARANQIALVDQGRDRISAPGAPRQAARLGRARRIRLFNLNDRANAGDAEPGSDRTPVR
jgi:hypothetical protein